jgi:formate dehydrogenase (NADP+) beta subunit
MRDREDLTRPPDLTAPRAPGAVRTRRAVYQDLLAPCNHACPAGENVQAWLALAQAGRLREAWETILLDNPFPAVHGRVCYHPCESVCNRAAARRRGLIHAVERFLGDLALAERWPAFEAPCGPQRAACSSWVGAGPSGLSAAYHLARLGHDVVVREAGPVAGGMMHFGIPAYRLPRDVLDGRDRAASPRSASTRARPPGRGPAGGEGGGGFDAVFVAVGAHLSKRVDIPMDAGHLPRRRHLPATGRLGASRRPRPARRGLRRRQHRDGRGARRAADRQRRPVIIYRRTASTCRRTSRRRPRRSRKGVRINWLRSITSMPTRPSSPSR